MQRGLVCLPQWRMNGGGGGGGGLRGLKPPPPQFCTKRFIACFVLEITFCSYVTVPRPTLHPSVLHSPSWKTIRRGNGPDPGKVHNIIYKLSSKY